MGSMADAKKHYNEKLVLKRIQHDAFMRERTKCTELLELERKQYMKQLNEDQCQGGKTGNMLEIFAKIV